MTEYRWALLDLLDRQVIDSTQHPVGKVDDLEFGNPDTTGDSPPRPRLKAILSGAEALGARMGGLVGTAISGSARRMLTEPRDGPRRIMWGTVAHLGYVIELCDEAAKLEIEPGLELWMRHHLIGPIPGSGRESS